MAVHLLFVLAAATTQSETHASRQTHNELSYLHEEVKALEKKSDSEAPSLKDENYPFYDEGALSIQNGIAELSLIAQDKSEFPWGTKRREHRWNNITVKGLEEALDKVEEAFERVSVMVLHNNGFYWSNGMDLNYMDAFPHDVERLVQATDALMARICLFPRPTVAAINGHFAAAGGMLGLAFDYRIMESNQEKPPVFFIPGIDLGLVYSPVQMALMTSKLPQQMHREVILFNTKKWTAPELFENGVVDAAVAGGVVRKEAMELAGKLKSKGNGSARKALGGIKRGLYKSVVDALTLGGGMGFEGRIEGQDRVSM